LGLDLSLTGTGWVLFESKDDVTPIQGLIDTNKLDGLERIDHILTEIKNLLQDKPFSQELSETTLVVIEDFSFASKGSSLFQIAGLGYIVRHWLWKNKIDFLLVPPTVLKKFVTGAGNSDKSVMLMKILKNWDVEILDDNIGDAYGLSRIGRAILEWDTNLLAFQKDAIKQLQKESK
jgi:Holliday junction resolvasome RuvABC endonuclease subunit